MARRRYTPKLKAQVVLEVLGGEKTPGQVAKAYGVAPELGTALEAAVRGPGAGGLRRGDDGEGVRAPDPGSGAAAGQEGGGDRPLKKLLGPERLSVEARVALVSGTREAYGLGPSLRAVELARSTWHHHTRTRVPYAEKYAHLEAPLKAIAEAHPEYGYRRTAAELRETYGHRVNREGRGAAAPAVGSALEAHGYAAEAERGPAGHRRRGSAREPSVGTAEGGDGAAGGLLHGLHRARPRRRDEKGVADPHPRSRDEVRPGLRRWSVGQLRLGALGLDGGGADPGPPPELARRDHRPPGPGPGVHRLRVDRPAAVGGRAPLPCPPRTEGQPGDGELLRPVQGGEPVINYYNRVRRHSSLGDRPPLGIIEDFYREG